MGRSSALRHPPITGERMLWLMMQIDWTRLLRRWIDIHSEDPAAGFAWASTSVPEQHDSIQHVAELIEDPTLPSLNEMLPGYLEQ